MPVNTWPNWLEITTHRIKVGKKKIRYFANAGLATDVADHYVLNVKMKYNSLVEYEPNGNAPRRIYPPIMNLSLGSSAPVNQSNWGSSGQTTAIIIYTDA